jgi:DNA polymerase-3 subunit gamma/tau
MSNFIVSARKYRPTRFEDVVGQQHVSQTLKNALQNDHLAHAFLFCGPRGVGKTTCARILAKVLNCQNVTDDFEPCGTCDSCVSFESNASFNITELDAASNNSVEHIRALIEQVRFQPQQGKYKVFIIDEVHMLSQQAFNAFLKTLEEPPSYAIFILATTEKHKIIPTILSRCQIFDFRRIQVQDIVEHLQGICEQESIKAENDALHIIGQKADGALRDALSIFDRIVSFSGDKITYDDVIENLNVLDYDYYFKLVEAMLVENNAQVLLTFDDVLRKGFDPDLFINGLAEHLRNLLVCKDEATLQLMELSEGLKERYLEQSRIVPARFLLTALNLCNDCDVNYKLARNKRLHVEMALIKMAFIHRAFQLSEGQHAPDSVEKKTPVPREVVSEAPDKQEVVPERENVTPPVAEPAVEAVVQEEPPPASPPEPEKSNAQLYQPVKTGKHDTPKLMGLEAALLEELKAEAAEEQSISAKDLKLEEVQAAWKQYAKTVDLASYRSFLQKSRIGLEGPAIKVGVSSELALSNIQQDGQILETLRKTLRVPELVLNVTVDERKKDKKPPERPKHLMTSKEKYLAMRETNPLLQEIQRRFDLRPDE